MNGHYYRTSAFISLVLVIAISLHTVEGKTYLSYYVTIVWGDRLSEAAFFYSCPCFFTSFNLNIHMKGFLAIGALIGTDLALD